MELNLKKLSKKELLSNKIALTDQEAHNLLLLDDKGFSNLNELRIPGINDNEKFKLKSPLQKDFNEKEINPEVINFAKNFEHASTEKMNDELKKWNKKIKGFQE